MRPQVQVPVLFDTRLTTTRWPSVRSALAVASALIALQQVNWVPALDKQALVPVAQQLGTGSSAEAPDASGTQLIKRFTDQLYAFAMEKWRILRDRNRPASAGCITSTRTLGQRCEALGRGCLTVLILKYLERRLDQDIYLLPGSLTGLVLLVGLLGVVEHAWSARALVGLERFVKPALAFLAEWMPLFFAPPLVALPARLYTGGASKRELLALAGVIVSGFLAGLWTTAAVTRSLMRWQSRERASTPLAENRASDLAPETSCSSRERAGAFADPVLFGLSSLLAILCIAPAQYWRDRLLLAVVTALSYRLGTRAVPKPWQRVLHPVLTCAGLTAVVASGLELSESVNADASWYKRLERYPFIAGNWFMQLLGPSLIALSFRLYRARALLSRQWLPLVGGSAFSAIFSLVWTAVASRILGLRTPALRAALFPRSITMPLAIASSKRLQADTSITVASVLISGILGASLGSMILRPGPEMPALARGVALGSVSHGLGTAALTSSGDSTAASAAVIALGLVGTLTTLLLSSPLMASFRPSGQ
ncbi:hypothetical protein, conserved [Cyanidioschyzon merolae strain 10D]|uniref:Uncharacterized protein n=1 Tax=Cyanidioschyzon merolae (strain NIES-3377 / 10D) TaxID=280699 RepID=M1VGX0_CYAM1|nr:hypothetical protein, conserved [Cyanidioschyzon merolae strain 10D]BAM82472.1 hypothetical protein, conserved [Cyanidioschyzon merolae strain 10D]|eukprot:XP_005538508.1 hypothetical protein, conserved [Cyanidioschyzon merolae strain 10D]